MKTLPIVALAVIALAAASAAASAQEPMQTQGLDARATAELGVETLLQTVTEHKALFTSDKDAFFAEVEEVLGYFVDFEAVAEVVMNRYAAQATAEQKTRFAAILRSTLTRFYGASLVSYEDEELVFLPNTAARGDDPRADQVVTMELRGETGLRLRYLMFINADDEWKLKNLSLAGINLGRQYYSSFAALMEQHDDDIDAVLDNWK